MPFQWHRLLRRKAPEGASTSLALQSGAGIPTSSISATMLPRASAKPLQLVVVFPAPALARLRLQVRYLHEANVRVLLAQSRDPSTKG